MTVIRIDTVDMIRCRVCNSFQIGFNDGHGQKTFTNFNNPHALEPGTRKRCAHLWLTKVRPTIWCRIWPSHRAAFKEAAWPW